MSSFNRTVCSILVAAGLAAPALAQPAMNILGTNHIAYIGHQVQELTIPNQPGALVQLSVTGADGGKATSHGFLLLEGKGGKGASTTITCRIGTGAGELAPGGKLRFIIGEKGEDTGTCTPIVFPCRVAGAGGGGSGVLYLPPNQTDWYYSSILAAAGAGGGGAVRSGDQLALDGFNAVINSSCGGNGHGYEANTPTEGRGGCDGNGGIGFELVNGSDNGMGGGGALSGGQSCCGTVRTTPGFPNGADGWTLSARDGGWGFGAGGGAAVEGVGAGGGGYSGGGSGCSRTDGNAAYGHPGGGGCGYVNTSYAISSLEAVGTDGDGGHGSGRYAFQRPPNDTPSTAFAFAAGDTLIGTTATGDLLSGPACDPAGMIADVWYSYTNPDADCTRRLSFTWSTPNTAVSLHAPGAIGTPIDCSNAGSLLTELSPGQTMLVRIATPLAPFTITTSGGIADADNDGICNNLDLCPSGDDSADCNNNGVPDCAEQIATSRTIGQNFDTTGHPYQLNGAAFIDSGAVRLVNNIANTSGTVVFQPLNPTDRVGSFRVDFDFKIGTSAGQSNEGLLFAALAQTEASPWSLSSSFGQEIIATLPLDSLIVNFNTYNTGSGPDNSVSVTRNGGGIGGALAPTFDMDNALWHHARITWSNFILTIELTPNGGSPQTVFSQNIAPFFPNPFFFAFAGGNANSTTNGRSWIDNVTIVDLSNDDDCDGDGIADGCDTLGCTTPLNDECSGALSVYVGDTSFNNDDATGTAVTSCSRTDLQDIWFTYTPTCSGPVRFETISTDGWLPTLAAYSTCGGPVIECARNNAPGNEARIDSVVTAGTPVVIRVAGHLFNSGNGVLRITGLADADGDGIFDDCDICPNGDDSADADGDGIADGCDICPGGDDAIDSDSDGVPDACDACPGFDDSIDSDGDGVPDGCEPVLTCPADFDQNGTVAVPDIFAFLSVWFAQGPGADFDQNEVIAVPDIFAFLSAWFAGC